jgi:hypothetical protein
MRSRQGQANEFSPSGVFFKEVAREIHSSAIFPSTFKKLPWVDRGPDRLISLFLSSIGRTKPRWRKGPPWSGHSASRSGCAPGAGGWLQSQAMRKLRHIVAFAGKYLVSNKNGIAKHLFMHSSPDGAQHAERGLTHLSRRGNYGMRFFRGIAILLAVIFTSIGIFMLYEPVSHQRAPASDQVILGAVFCALALTLVYFVSRPVVK